MSGYINLTQETFDSVADKQEGIVFLDFWAPWCGPCKMFGPTFEAAALKNTDIVFGKINTEDEQELAQHFHIRSIPTLMALRDGVVVFKQAGAMSAGQFDQLIQGVRDLDMEKVKAEIAAGK